MINRTVVVLVGLLGAVGCEARHQRTTFFGLESGDAARVVYVMDRSGSMTDSVDFVNHELKGSIGSLPEQAEFTVIFYSSGPPFALTERSARGEVPRTVEAYKAPGLFRASDRNKRMAFDFIDRVVPQGGTEPEGAVRLAFSLEPDVIYLFTDGEFARSLVELVKLLNPEGKVVVHTISYAYVMSEEVKKTIASQNGGQYRFVTGDEVDAFFRNRAGGGK